MTAAEKLAMIDTAIAAGSTVYLATALRITKITPKVAAAWLAFGKPVVKVSGSSLYVAEGKRYVCADYCAIRVS